jgi:hypothetical protein
MKRSLSVVTLGLFITLSASYGQFRSKADQQPKPSESIRRSDESGLLFGFFDPRKLVMRQSYSLSYTSFGGGQGVSLGAYTNSLQYQFSDPLSVQFDVSLMHSPFGGFNDRMARDLTGIHLTRAQLNYRPTENVLFQLQYRQMPSMYFLPNGYRDAPFFSGGAGLQSSEEEKR